MIKWWENSKVLYKLRDIYWLISQVLTNLVPEVDANSFVSEGVSECSVLLSGSSSRLEDSSLTVVVTDRNNSGMDSFCSRKQIADYLELFFWENKMLFLSVLSNPFKYPTMYRRRENIQMRFDWHLQRTHHMNLPGMFHSKYRWPCEVLWCTLNKTCLFFVTVLEGSCIALLMVTTS